MMCPSRATLALLALIIPLPAAAFNFTPSEPKPVPELSFQDAQGNQVSLANFRGQVVVLNLWATWCAPCLREMPSLDRLQAKLGGDRLQVVALSIDRGGVEQIEAFYEEVGIRHLEIYRDPKATTSRALGAFGLPTTVVIDPDGREVGRVLGPDEWDSDAVVAALQALMDPAARSDWGGEQAAAQGD
ncbi:MAG TPA: TlpA disulfide reductase family protein [Geminicoccaceae bacterium]|nr:TlpA disulfide reductase family protein [Geminicoccaceae bacterium]